jgi:predicted transcriptional regulator
MALKRGAGRKPTEFDERFMSKAAAAEADEAYEKNVFRAKVYAAIRQAEPEADFLQFQVYRMRVFDGLLGKEVAEQLGISEPTVSRHLHRIRALLRRRLAETISTYSFTEDEQREAAQAGLGEDDSTFDEALCDIYHQQSQLILQDETAASAAF